MFEAAGLHDIDETTLTASLEHPSFEEWWEPFTRGVGPAGSFVAGLDAERQAELRERCRSLLPVAPFVLTSTAWATRGPVADPPGAAPIPARGTDRYRAVYRGRGLTGSDLRDP